MTIGSFRLMSPTPQAAAVLTGFAFGALVLSAASVNPILTFASIATAGLLYALLRRPGEPPILLFAVGIQWLQVTTKVFHADLLGLPIGDLIEEAGDLYPAVLLALAGLCVLALGIRAGLARQPLPSAEQARAEVARFSPVHVWVAYLIFLGAEIATTGTMSQLSGLYQPMLALLSVKWALLFVLAYLVFVRRTGFAYLLGAMALELYFSLGGFFGGFKTVFLIVLIGTMSAKVRFTLVQKFLITTTIVVLLLLCIVWSAIKQDYRAFLNQGSGAQVVVVTQQERIDYLAEVLGNFDGHDFMNGIEKLVDRISYIDGLAAVVSYVPSIVGYTGGTQTEDAVAHILTPRLLFPNKPPTPSDSEVTETYTGLHVSGEAEGTSISIGYMAEFYVDFGPYLMYLPILMLGWFFGLGYCTLLRRGHGSLLMRYGLTVMVFFGFASFEIALIKLVGSLVTTFLVAFVISRFLLPWLEPRWIRRQESQARSA